MPTCLASLLSKRLGQLEQAGIVDHLDDEYVLTPAGEDLRPVVFGLGEWGAKWQFDDPRESELDPELLMWWVHGRLDASTLPDRRTVLQFHFTDTGDWFWIVHEAQGASICMHDPGFGIYATIEAELSTMYQVWLGKLALRTALRDGRVELGGTPAVVRRLPETLQLSPIAETVAAARR